ncbi:MAG: pyridoxal phosphate-dependent aminotransferase [Clostridia bacterium]|nr:pyridoxal phosphate-dependent aminotransferase [Clostridia bacterium]
MKYDFDKIIDRHNTSSLKYDFAKERGCPEDAIPLWVADMDFLAPEAVRNALRERIDHGIFGYSDPREGYFNALQNWCKTHYNWKVEPKNYILTCGVVFALCALIRALTKEGDGIIICQPVYYPFEESIRENNRTLIVSQLKFENGHYSVDYEDFERKIVENDVKLFILCNPHNPVGRVWTKAELERLGDICLKHNVFVISDEIHADFAHEGHKHTVFATVKKEFEENSAICTAPTKTFNLAGLHISNIYIANDTVRAAMRKEMDRVGYCQPNVMGLVACEAAYTHCADWLEELKAYLAGNLDFVRERLKNTCLKLVEPEGTYLVWIDCRALGLSDEELHDFVLNKAKLWLDDGSIFGIGGSGFERINLACPRSVLSSALDRLVCAVDGIKV